MQPSQCLKILVTLGISALTSMILSPSMSAQVDEPSAEPEFSVPSDLAAQLDCDAQDGSSVPTTSASMRAAFLFAFGPYQFARNLHLGRLKAGDIGDGVNKVYHIQGLADHTARHITTPNNDTLYSTVILELSNGPVEFVVPTNRERYVSIMLMDIFTDAFAVIGADDANKESITYWILGPSWKGIVPENVRVIRSPSNDAWAIGRFFVAGPEDLPAAQAVQSDFVVRSVNGTTPHPFEHIPNDPLEPENFVAVVNELFSRSPDHPQLKRVKAFETHGVGLGPTDGWSSLSCAQRQSWQTVLDSVLRSFKSGRKPMRKGAVWTKPIKNLGRYGEDDLTRSRISLVGFGALPAEEATYFSARTDSNGSLLVGDKNYTMTIPTQDVPTNAFWSLSVYELMPDGRQYFAENSIERYSINSATPGLVTNPNGDLKISFSLVEPTDPSQNWFPIPAREFGAIFRVYRPKPTILDGSWGVPLIHQTKPVSGEDAP